MKELLLHLPADVLDAPFTLLLELHISLDGLLQVQDRGVLYYDHSCIDTWELTHVRTHSQNLRCKEWNPDPVTSALLDRAASGCPNNPGHGP